MEGAREEGKGKGRRRKGQGRREKAEGGRRKADGERWKARRTEAIEKPLAPPEILDLFVQQGPITAEELESAVRRFKRVLIERALGGELTHHLGYPPVADKPEATTNHRNGTGAKPVLTDDGPLTIDVPRDRARTVLRS